MRTDAPGQSALLMLDVADALVRDGIPALLAVCDSHGNRVDLLIGLRALDVADARAALQLDQGTLDLELVRRLTARFGRGAERTLESLLAELS